MFLHRFATFFIQSVILSSNLLLQSGPDVQVIRPRDKGNDWKSEFKFIGSMNQTRGGTTRRIIIDENGYYVSVNPATWNNAVGDCKAAFGPDSHLLTINTEQERDYVNKMLESYGIGQYWTGGIFDANTEMWRWEINNKPLPNWAPWEMGYPSNPGPSQRVLLVETGSTSSWRTIYNTQIHRYICKVPNEKIAVPCETTIDLVIALDASNRIGATSFDAAKDFAIQLAAAYKNSRLGFVTYSTSAKSIFGLNHPLIPQIRTGFIKSARYNPDVNSVSVTDEAIDEAVSQFYRIPKSVPRIIVVLTDGKSDNPLKTAASSNLAIAKGISIFTVGITSDFNKKGLLDITGGNATRVFTADNLNEFNNLLKPLSLILCPSL